MSRKKNIYLNIMQPDREGHAAVGADLQTIWCRCEWSFTYTLSGHVPNLRRDLKDLDGRCILICPFVKG